MSSFLSFIDELDCEAEQLTLGKISHVECSPMPAVALAKIEGQKVTQEEIVAASNKRAEQRQLLLEIFDQHLRVYADHNEATSEVPSSADYFNVAREWCRERDLSVLVIDGSPKEKLEKFFQLLEDMGMDDVEELAEDRDTLELLCSSLDRMKMYYSVPMSAWDASRPLHFDMEDWVTFKKLFKIGIAKNGDFYDSTNYDQNLPEN